MTLLVATFVGLLALLVVIRYVDDDAFSLRCARCVIEVVALALALTAALFVLAWLVVKANIAVAP